MNDPKPPSNAPVLTARSTLRRARGLTVSFDDDESPIFECPGEGVVEAGPFGLAVLEVFSRPTSIARASEVIQGRVQGAEGFMQAMDTLFALARAGVLVSEDEATARAAVEPMSGYTHPGAHRVMLDDRVRTDSFLRAIRSVVRAGDVVLDIGTGSGVLAVAAAMAGAARVYALEASGIAEVARSVFEANGVADRVTVVEGWSTDADIPERADVLVTEMLGNDPFDERLLEIWLDARARLLKPDARVVPWGVQVIGRAFRLPDDEVDRLRLTAATVADWRDEFGIELEPLLRASRLSSRAAMPRSERLARWLPVGDEVVLADVDLMSLRGSQLDAAAPLVFEEDTEIDGAVLSFIAWLDAVTSITTDPFDPSRASHWRNKVVLLGESVVVPAGVPALVTYRYRVPGHPDGLGLDVGGVAT